MGDNSDDDVRVSSTLYNLAGPESGRVDFLKSLVVGALAQDVSVSDAIKSGYLHGPAVHYRNFLHWAQNNAAFLAKFGTTSGKIGSVPSVDYGVVKTALNTILAGDGLEANEIVRAEVGKGKVHFWVLRYAAENGLAVPRPNPPYSGDNSYTYDSGGNEVSLLPGPVLFNPASPAYDPTDLYLYVKYTPCVPHLEHAISYGSTDTLAGGDPDPDFSNPPWLKMDDCTTGVDAQTVTSHDELDRTYSDARTPVHVDYPSFDTDVSEPTRYDHYVEEGTVATDTDGSKYSIRTHKEFWVSYVLDSRDVVLSDTTTSIGGGVTRHDVVTRTEQYLRMVRQVRVSTQKITYKTLLPDQWYIYLYESGNADLDDEMVDPAPTTDEAFYPPIPFRLDNKAVGPLVKTATRWRIHVGALDFTWDEDKYDMTFDIDERDVQVSLYDGSDADHPAHWVSLKWISSPAANQHYVEHRKKDDDATISGVAGRDDVDFDIEINYPLYRVFSKATDDHPGFYRVRVQNPSPPAPYDNEWIVLSGPTQLLEKPTPSDYGIDPEMEELYDVAKKAYKKATGQKFDNTLASVLDNDNIDEIDFAYTVFGVSFNVKDNSCRKYIYRMLEHMLVNADGGESEADNFFEQYTTSNGSWDAWQEWYDATHDEDGNPITEYTDDTGTHHEDIPPEPAQVEYPVIPWKSLTVESTISGYKSVIQWAFIDRTRGTGVLTKTAAEGGGAAEVGDIWWSIEDDPFFDWDVPDDYARLGNVVTLNWQQSADHWEKLTVWGMTHENHIYEQYTITYTAKESVNWTKKEHSLDDDGNLVETDSGEYQESGFIFPMHGQIYRDMSMRDATQMATACTFLVFNSYSLVDHPWYTSTWFKVIVIIVIVVISIIAAVFSGGSSLGVGGAAVEGLLVGAGVGTTAAIVIGALADILVGMALSYFASWLATRLFGKKIGGIVGAILGLALGAFSAGGMNALEKLFTSPDGWIAISMALGNGTAQLLQMQAQETMRDTLRMMAQNDERIAKIQEMFQKQFGDEHVDPNKVSQYLNELLQSPDTFLQRTLMSGSDIVDATLSQVDDFVDDRLNLVLP